MNKPRVLLLNELANPDWVGPPLHGWAISQSLSNLASIHSVIQVRSRQAILNQGLVEGRDFTAIDSEAIAKLAWKLSELIRGGEGRGLTTLQALHGLQYYYFEHLVWKKFFRRIINKEFDIVHRLTPISPTIPSLIAQKCKRNGVPFIIGPINGGLAWPKNYNYVRNFEHEWLSYLRPCHKLMPGYYSTWRNAAAIMAGSIDAWNQIKPEFRQKLIYLSDNAIDPALFQGNSTHKPARSIKVIFVGRLTPFKGVDMLIDAAIPLLKRNEITLEIIGDGPQMPALKKIVKDSDVEGKVSFTGWVEHKKLREKLISSDVFAFPSIREFGGAVVPEAMAVGLVPIVVNYGGPPEFLTPRCGFTVQLGPRDYIVKQFRDILAELAGCPEIIERKASFAQKRIFRYFTWPKKAEQIFEVYRWVLGDRIDKPDFGMPYPDTD